MPVGQLITVQHTWNVSPLLQRNVPYRTVYSMSTFFITDAPTPSKFAWLADRNSGSSICLHRQPLCGDHLEFSLYGFLYPFCIPWNLRTASKPAAHLPSSSCEIRHSHVGDVQMTVLWDQRQCNTNFYDERAATIFRQKRTTTLLPEDNTVGFPETL